MQALVLRPLRFESANPRGGGAVNEAGGLPAIENAFPPSCQGSASKMRGGQLPNGREDIGLGK